MQADEIAGRIEALCWFVTDLAAELDVRGVIDGDRFGAGLCRTSQPHDQLEYMRVGHRCLVQLAKTFDEVRADLRAVQRQDGGCGFDGRS